MSRNAFKEQQIKRKMKVKCSLRHQP